MSDQPGNRWDERYDHERYYYGERAQRLHRHPPAHPAERVRPCSRERPRRRIAVYAARLGHRVLAVDSSGSAAARRWRWPPPAT
ncbi:MAG: hypothetical protein IPO18_08990 [bacterium]|nr:hypothetical protein [bacterium]